VLFAPISQPWRDFVHYLLTRAHSMRIRTLAVAAALAITGHSAFADSILPTEKLADDVKVATPFGLAIGKTTCAEAAELLGATVEQNPLAADLYSVRAANPGKLYPGAYQIDALCSGSELPVGMLTVLVKGPRWGFSSGDEAYAALASKYQRALDEPNQRARKFNVAGGDTVVELFTHSFGHEFSIWYSTGSVQKRQSEEKARAAREAADGAAAQRSKAL
jgi:hypothetical protein